MSQVVFSSFFSSTSLTLISAFTTFLPPWDMLFSLSSDSLFWGYSWPGMLPTVILVALLCFYFRRAELGISIVLILYLGGWGFLCSLFILPTPLRRYTLSWLFFYFMVRAKILPKVSDTEKVALETGDVWVERELFSSYPRFEKLFDTPVAKLSDEEQAFLDGPVEEVLDLCNEFEIWKTRRVPDKIMSLLKKHKFYGMIIPKEFGGLGFSNHANSSVVKKVTSRSASLGIYVGVPNSLGPGELLVHYGTDEQQKRYLPKLATGELIPCFALTEPTAGSDATAIQAEGVVFKGVDGKLGIRLNFRKRWISLAGIATLIGLAFKLRDPEGLLGQEEELGITCALIDRDTPGLDISRRHDPMGVPFHNNPVVGVNVEIPLEENVIGGRNGVGRGWEMLVYCLTAGRGVCLPAMCGGSHQDGARYVLNHAFLRHQFGTPIDSLEGVQEPLSKIVRDTYALESMRLYTNAGLDQGVKSAVVSAIAKYYASEKARAAGVAMMDVLGGKGISLGPKNSIAPRYIYTPIAITVEGANILNRTLIIFGQGLLRAHNYLFDEIKALETGDLKRFDKAFWRHGFDFLSSGVRVCFMALTKGHIVYVPAKYGKLRPYLRRLVWVTSYYSFLVDLSLLTLGGKLKFKGAHSGRMADIIIHLYEAVSIMKRYHVEKQDWPLAEYALDSSFEQLRLGFNNLSLHFPWPKGFKWVLRRIHIFWDFILNSFAFRLPDQQYRKVLESIKTDPARRQRLLLDGVHMPKGESHFECFQEQAFILNLQTRAIEMKLTKWQRRQMRQGLESSQEQAVKAGVINAHELEIIQKARKLRLEAIEVDEFTEEEYLSRHELGRDSN